GIAINIETPEGRVEGLECCGLSAGTTTSLHRLGHTHDLEGRLIDRERIFEALSETAPDSISRSLSLPVDWGA
ncbi:MAG: hypothetical protein EBU26_17460, partial [Verrucomicrobia bacterium]|nr:hypothetical protein [Verrucomicrobiota bacterium]